MFFIMKCHRCGRIFVYYGDRKAPHCPNVRCHTMVTKKKETVLPINFDFLRKMKLILKNDLANSAFIYETAFNNELSLSADVYSTDGLHFITIPLNTDKLKITVEDLLENIPQNSKKTEDGKIIIKSGKYSIIYNLNNKLKVQFGVAL